MSEIEHRRTKSFYRISLMAARACFHKTLTQPQMSFFRFSTVLEFIFLSVRMTRSTRIHIHGVRFRSFSRLPRDKTTVCRVHSEEKKKEKKKKTEKRRKIHRRESSCCYSNRNDPRSMEVLAKRSKPSFLLPKKRGQISHKGKEGKKETNRN